jgi:sugar diacid utilization regulator
LTNNNSISNDPQYIQSNKQIDDAITAKTKTINLSYVDQLEGVLEIARIITSTFAWEEIMENIVKKAVDLIDGADTGAIFLYNNIEDLLIPEYGWGFAWEYLQKIRLKPTEALSGKVFTEKKPILYKSQSEIVVGMDDLRSINQVHYKNIFPFYNQHFRSSMAAPLMWKEDCLGVLILHNVRSNQTFTESNLRLVEHVASHAAVALVNSRLYKKQQKHLAKLTRTVHVHEKLTQMVLSGEGLVRISSELAELLSQTVYIYDAFLDCIASGFSEEEDTVEGFDMKTDLTAEHLETLQKYRRPIYIQDQKDHRKGYIVEAIAAGESVLGYMVVGAGQRDINMEQQITIEQAATVMALEMMKKKVAYETEKRVKGDLLQEILQKNITKETSRKLSVFGYSPKHSYICCCLSIQSNSPPGSSAYDNFDMIEHFLRSVPHLVTFPQSDDYVMLLPFESVKESMDLSKKDRFKDVFLNAQSFLKKLEQSFPIKIQMGVGRLFYQLEELKTSYSEARQALELLKKYGGDDRLWTYRSLGPLRFLLQVAGEEALYGYMNEVLGALFEKDINSGGKLLETLETWISCDRQVKKSAEALFIHPNTLTYRLQKIEGILDVDLHNEEDWLTVQLAIRLWQTLKPDKIG